MKIIYVDMVADLFHYGHVEFLKKSKDEGDFLIVGIVDDDFATSYKRKPIMNFDECYAVIEACRYVDKVLKISDPIITEEFINKNKINLVCHSFSDNSDLENQRKYYDVPIKLNIFKNLPYTKTISTTDIINRISNTN